MGSTRRFVLSRFGRNYLLVFTPFLFIVSLIFLIQLATLSARISIDGWDFLRAYSYFIPQIIYYTLPLSFIAALTATLTQLSEDNELVALFSFGYTPIRLLRIFFWPTLLFSALMLVIALWEIPKNKLRFDIFKYQKLTEAKLMIAPNRLGQKFGNYMVFIGDKEENRYHDIVLFSTTHAGKRMIFVADQADIVNDNASFALNLYDGSGATFLPETIESVTYKQMSLYSYPKKKFNLEKYQRGWNKITYDRREMARFVHTIFVSLSPLLTLMLIAAFSITNPRYQKSHTYLVTFVVTLLTYTIAVFLQKKGTFLLLGLSVAVFIGAGAFLFHAKIRRHF